MNEIVSAEWLNKNLENPDLTILDASIVSSVDGKYSESHKLTIPRSKLFDLKEVFLDKSNPFQTLFQTKNFLRLSVKNWA